MGRDREDGLGSEGGAMGVPGSRLGFHGGPRAPEAARETYGGKDYKEKTREKTKKKQK